VAESLIDSPEISERGLVLVKVPKTGTQSLDKAIVSACAGEPVEAFRKYKHPAVLNNQRTERLWPRLHNFPHLAGWTLRGHLRARSDGLLLSRRTAWEAGGLVLPSLQIPLMRRQRYRIMTCHWPWRYDPKIYRRVMVSDHPIVVTLLREPLKRILSTYFYRLRRTPGYKESQGSVEDFHQYLKTHDRSYYARWYSWPSSRNRPDKSEALRTIRERLSIVGTTDRFSDFVELLSARLGVSLETFNENPTRKTFGMDDLPPKTLRLLDEVSAADQELYAEASKRFATDWDEQFGSARAGPARPPRGRTAASPRLGSGPSPPDFGLR
jgi:hypothetical protein